MLFSIRNVTKAVTFLPDVCWWLFLTHSPEVHLHCQVLKFSALMHALLDSPYLALSFLSFTFRTHRRKLHLFSQKVLWSGAEFCTHSFNRRVIDWGLNDCVIDLLNKSFSPFNNNNNNINFIGISMSRWHYRLQYWLCQGKGKLCISTFRFFKVIWSSK